jgi:hypothetical protein
MSNDTHGIRSLVLAIAAGIACGISAYAIRRARPAERTHWNSFDRHSKIDEELDESFPASDPPSFTPATVGAAT